MLAHRRVKVVATIGPSTNNKEALANLMKAGMNVARLNFSHGEHAQHEEVIKNIRELSQELSCPVAILQDLQGPKIRVGQLTGGEMLLKEKDRVILSTKAEMGEANIIPTDFHQLPKDVKSGTKILLDDGLMELKVIATDEESEVECEVVYGGTLKNRKGMNIPGVNLTVDCLTPKDLRDLDFGLQQKVDYVALSFVRRPEDMFRLREIVNEKYPIARTVAKIEMLEAIEHLEAVVQNSDAVMVARGDLAIEVGQSFLPGLQKRIIRMCNKHAVPVITATQMLESMIQNPRPTRAEVTDVANAILDGTDALMLSAETATGKYPSECIKTFHDIALEVENTDLDYYRYRTRQKFSTIARGIAESACLTADKLDAKIIVCLTTTGKTASMIASIRPKAKIIGATHIEETLNRLEVVWGIQTVKIKPYQDATEAMTQVESYLLNYGLAEKGDRVILTLGFPVSGQAKTNALRVHVIGDTSLDSPKKPLRFQ